MNHFRYAEIEKDFEERNQDVCTNGERREDDELFRMRSDDMDRFGDVGEDDRKICQGCEQVPFNVPQKRGIA